MGEISAVVPDWSREKLLSAIEWNPGRQLLHAIRRYNYWVGRNPARAKFWAAVHRYWTVVSGAEIPLTTKLGGGLLLPHPNGIVIHPDVCVGPNCLIMQQVTLGTGSLPGVPRIGGHVDIFAGAKVLGGVTVGDHARIGANAVVLSDVPAGETVAGVPARIVTSRRVLTV